MDLEAGFEGLRSHIRCRDTSRRNRGAECSLSDWRMALQRADDRDPGLRSGSFACIADGRAAFGYGPSAAMDVEKRKDAARLT